MNLFKRNQEAVQINTINILKTQMQIEMLKEQLTQTDYQIIKCYEYSLIGKELPYDMTALHNERQVIRNKINALQGGDNK